MDRDRPGLHVRYDGSVPGDRNSRRAVTGVDGLGERAAGGIDDRNCPVAAQKSYEAARQRPTQESSLPDPMISWVTRAWAILCPAPVWVARLCPTLA